MKEEFSCNYENPSFG